MRIGSALLFLCFACTLLCLCWACGLLSQSLRGNQKFSFNKPSFLFKTFACFILPWSRRFWYRVLPVLISLLDKSTWLILFQPITIYLKYSYFFMKSKWKRFKSMHNDMVMYNWHLDGCVQLWCTVTLFHRVFVHYINIRGILLFVYSIHCIHLVSFFRYVFPPKTLSISEWPCSLLWFV